MTKRMICSCAAALLLAASLGTAWADSDGDSDSGGTGLALGRQQHSFFGWNDPYRDHRDYVEDFGIGDCVGCHVPGLEGYSGMGEPGRPGCMTCHGNEWGGGGGGGDSDSGGGDAEELSLGNELHGFLGWSRPFRDHRDYAEDNGVQVCIGCHVLEVGGKESPSTFDPPGCLSCHGREWDGGGGGGGGDSDSDSRGGWGGGWGGGGDSDSDSDSD